MLHRNKFGFVFVSARTPREGEESVTPTTTPTPTPTVTPAPVTVTFSAEQQSRINTLLAEEKRKITDAAQKTNQTLISQLEDLRNNKSLTEKEKENLTSRIEELTTQYQTKEQAATSDYQKLQKKYETDTKQLKTESETYKGRFENKLKTVDLQAAAMKHEAVNPKQVEKLLWDLTVVEPDLDSEGKPTGDMVTRVNWIGKDKDGNPVKLKLKVEDAVKAMTEIPDEYGNLFKNPAKGGLNSNTNGGGDTGRIPNIEQMTPQQWAQHRAKIKAEMQGT